MSCSAIDKVEWSTETASGQTNCDTCTMPSLAKLNCQLPSTSLQLLKVIGRGATGTVHKADWAFHSGKVGVFCSSVCCFAVGDKIELIMKFLHVMKTAVTVVMATAG